MGSLHLRYIPEPIQKVLLVNGYRRRQETGDMRQRRQGPGTRRQGIGDLRQEKESRYRRNRQFTGETDKIQEKKTNTGEKQTRYRRNRQNTGEKDNIQEKQT